MNRGKEGVKAGTGDKGQGRSPLRKSYFWCEEPLSNIKWFLSKWLAAIVISILRYCSFKVLRHRGDGRRESMTAGEGGRTSLSHETEWTEKEREMKMKKKSIDRQKLFPVWPERREPVLVSALFTRFSLFRFAEFSVLTLSSRSISTLRELETLSLWRNFSERAQSRSRETSKRKKTWYRKKREKLTEEILEVQEGRMLQLAQLYLLLWLKIDWSQKLENLLESLYLFPLPLLPVCSTGHLLLHFRSLCLSLRTCSFSCPPPSLFVSFSLVHVACVCLCVHIIFSFRHQGRRLEGRSLERNSKSYYEKGRKKKT